MIWLIAMGVLIAAATAWYLARPLARTAVPDDREQRHQLEQLRERLLVQMNELDVEEGDRNIDSAVLTDERVRLEAELASVLRELEPPKKKGGRKKAAQETRLAWIAALVVFGVVLPFAATGLYAMKQYPVLAFMADPAAHGQASPPDVMQMVARLEQRLADQPDDAAGWHRLGRTYAVLGRQEPAGAAYARAYRLSPDDPELLAEYAAFLYESDPQNTGGQVFGLFSRLHQLDPENRDALWFLGFAAYQKAEHKKAIGYWERLLKTLPPESAEAVHLRAIIANTREQQGNR